MAVPGAIMTGVFLTAGAPELDRAIDVAQALEAIAAVPFGDDALERDRILMTHLIDGRADAAVRAARPGHLTGSAFVVDSSAERALLLFHTKLQRWLQPGGHADGDTNPNPHPYPYPYHHQDAYRYAYPYSWYTGGEHPNAHAGRNGAHYTIAYAYRKGGPR